MALQATNLVIQASQLPATFAGKPNDLFRAMIERMRIVSPSGTGFFVIGDNEPPNNQGPWLKGGTQWWVWDEDLKRYVPLDVSESETKWYQIGATTPTTSEPPLWLRTTANATEAKPSFGTPVAWYLFDGTTWIQLPVLIEDRSITQAKLHWNTPFFGTASGTDNYVISFSPNTGFTLGDGAATSILFLVKFPNTNTGPVTLNVNSSGPIPVKKFTSEAIVAGEIVAGSIHAISFDGTNYQVLSSIPNRESGVVLNTVTKISNVAFSGALMFPYDNTPPENTEGNPYNDLETVYSAKRANSKLIVDVKLQASTNNGTYFITALFKDSDTNALAASSTSIVAVEDEQATLRAIFDVGDTSPHTYKVRFGPSASAATVFINQNSTAPTFGGTLMSSLTIMEVSA